MLATPDRNQRRPRWWLLILLPLALLVVIAVLYVTYRGARRVASDVLRNERNTALSAWFNDASSRATLATSFSEPCPGAPFLVPSSGLVGGLPYNAAYGPYTVLNPHSGIDIFGLGEPGRVPVYAAYDGELTREAGWRSAVIIRHRDPLQPGRTIWTYYTHMADRSGNTSYIEARFPPGSSGVAVQQGELIGYQGNYNGGPNAPRVGLHLHFSIVRSDLLGNYLNESVFENTLDPTPYLGLALNDPPSEAFPLRCQNTDSAS